MYKVTFYFDYISPYAFLAFKRFKLLRQRFPAEKLSVTYKPVLFAGLLNHWGQLGPAEIPAKRDFVFRDVYRFAKLHDISFSVPRAHPFNPISALRMSLPSVFNHNIEEQEHMIDAFYSSLWGDASGVGIFPNEKEFARIARSVLPNGMKFEELIERSTSDRAKLELRQNCEEAIQAGAFGVPTWVVDGPASELKQRHLLWGNDQLQYLELILQGKGSLFNVDAEYEKMLQNMPAQAVRPRAKM